MAPGKQNVRAACPKDKLEFKFFQALSRHCIYDLTFANTFNVGFFSLVKLKLYCCVGPRGSGMALDLTVKISRILFNRWTI